MQFKKLYTQFEEWKQNTVLLTQRGKHANHDTETLVFAGGSHKSAVRVVSNGGKHR